MGKWGQPAESRKSEPLPETIAELEDLRVSIIEEMNDIRNQLAGRKADMEQAAIETGQADRYGKPMANRQEWATYNEWRARATSALRHKEVELQDVKLALKERRIAHGATGEPGPAAVPLTDDPLKLLGAITHTAHRLACRIGHDKIDAADQAVIDYVRGYLQERA